jgi:hypothetical protein
MSNTDNFDALWDNLKEQVRAARGNPSAIYTNGEDPLTQRHGARVYLSSDMDGTVTVGVGMPRASIRFSATNDDLLTIAAKCIATHIDNTHEKQA